MQLLSLQDRLPNTISDRLKTSLQDIVCKIQIESNFCVRHADYKPLELPTEAVERFGQLPLNLQQKYLSLQLRSFLYGIYYNSSLQSALAPNTDADDRALLQNLENNTYLGVDLAFYERLHDSNSGEGYFDPDWQVLREESDGSLAVHKHGLTLHVERDRHLPPAIQSITVGDAIAIRLPKNRVQNGFYMAVSNVGLYKHQHSDTEPEVVRVYFNLSSEGAIVVMGSLTRQLNEIELPFTFKVLYNPADYGRYDSGVLYFDRHHYANVRSVLQKVYAENRSHFRSSVPLFTKLLAPGLAVAEEPERKFSEQESFGTHRCQIVANGLLEARATGDESPASRIAAILQQFSLAGIGLDRVHLNANSEDIYTPLDLDL